MNLKDFVLSHIKPDDYYVSRFPQWSLRDRANICCPFHDDNNPSMQIGLSNGGAVCYAASCGKKFGNVVHFESALKGVDERESATKLYGEFVRPVLGAGQVPTFATLQVNRKLLRDFEADTGISTATCRKFGIGFSSQKKRFSFPVENEFGLVVNIRWYRPAFLRTPADEKFKVINEKGFGACDLFPWQAFGNFSLDKPLFICASEKETLLALQEGLQAVCATAGEGAWPDDVTEHLDGFDVVLFRQNDEASTKAFAKIFAKVRSKANTVTTINPPQQHKDWGDWFLAGGRGIHVLKLVQDNYADIDHEAVGSAAPSPVAMLQSKSDPQPNPLSDFPSVPELACEEFIDLAYVTSLPKYLNKRVRTKGIIAAKASTSYTLPFCFGIKPSGKPEKRWALSTGRELIRFVKSSDYMIEEVIQEILGDDKIQIRPLTFVNVTEVELIPVASIEKDSPYVVQRCFFIGSEFETNFPYEFEIVPVSEMRTQETVGLVVAAKPLTRMEFLENFSEEDIATLQVFKPLKTESAVEKLESLAETLSQHYTKIYNRPDWHLVALLSWICPIGWKFPHEDEIQRGWMNSLAVGDTQTGKSEVIHKLRELFRSGEVVNAENCTFVGLVGGAIKMGAGQFMLRWGKLPLCDKQLVVLEELSGLSISEISNMSEVRSSGIARLDKGGLSSETNARTRLIALSNVRSMHKSLAGYLSGVRAVQDLVGHGEDISRFDLIITLIDREVSVETINTPASEPTCRKIPVESFQKLCQFAWSLKPEQIHFMTDSYFLCLEKTQELARKYHPSIPLFKGGSGRYKIARIAAAIATLQFSFSNGKVRVNEEHIEAACWLLEQLYDKPSMGYDQYSNEMFDRDDIKDEEILNNKVEQLLNLQKRAKVMETLIHASKFTRDELCAIGSLSISQADDLIGCFVRERVVRKGDANLWEITQPGKTWMEKHAKVVAVAFDQKKKLSKKERWMKA